MQEHEASAELYERWDNKNGIACHHDPGHGLDSQDRIQTHQGQELEEGQDKSWRKRGDAQGNTPTGEMPTGDPRHVQTPRHSVALAPAGEEEEGCGSQPAETTAITFLKAKGETQQTRLPAHADSMPAPDTSLDSSAGAGGCPIPRAPARPPRQASSWARQYASSLAGWQVHCHQQWCRTAQAVLSVGVPPSHPLSPQGAPSCVPGDVLACISAQSGAGTGQAELQSEPSTVCI